MTRSVRPFTQRDRQALLAIGADTAFFGEPIERYMEDRRLFMDGFYSYYTDYEPEHAWVACDEETVVGFLTGCTSGARQSEIMRRKIIPAMLWKLAKGYYHPGPKTWRYIRAAAMAGLRGEIPGADEKIYPAHLHINLLPGWRGLGLGRGLMEAYIDQLREDEICGVHLQTSSLNTNAIQLYQKVGFRLIRSKPTHMYAHLVDTPVEHLCFGRILSTPG